MKQKRTILIAVADLHSGSTTGVMRPEPWNLTVGGTYHPNEAQGLIYKQWIEGWQFGLDLRKRRLGLDRLVVVHLGDGVDGDHHDTPELVTRIEEEQQRIHIDLMDEALRLIRFEPKQGDVMYYVKGTSAHVGQGGASEERIARDLDGVRPRVRPRREDGKDGRFLWDHLSLNINGCRFDLAHKGGATGRAAWTRSDSLRQKIKSVYFDKLNHRQPIPRYWARAHHHRYVHAQYEDEQGVIDGFILPALQLKTEWMHAQYAGEMSDIGTMLFEVEVDGSSRWWVSKLTFQESREEVL